MSADKRSVSTDALETLGTIIPEGCGRDAIHVAVEPCVAGEKLFPGQDVGIENGVAYASGAAGNRFGIVDPFLKEPVFEGQRFWMLLYPRTITSLRHVWSHPAFEDATLVQVGKEASEAWLREFCETADCPSYDTVMAAITGTLDDDYVHFRWEDYGDGPVLFFNGTDAHAAIPPEFWDHAEAVTGNQFGPEKRATYFSCTC